MASRAPTKDTRQVLLDSAQRAMSRKGFAAVGLNEVLTAAGVPKGSFYHFFPSKDAFGEAMMQDYFVGYLADMDRVLAEPDLTAAERLMGYFEGWRGTQSLEDCQGKCLAVKLGAEVADLSESMRRALQVGVASIVDRIEHAIRSGADDGSITTDGEPRATAEVLCDLWLGASVVAKINRSTASLDTAMIATRQLLHR
jgi:TetR/AcrR family transcriptional repressor of nem operon